MTDTIDPTITRPANARIERPAVLHVAADTTRGAHRTDSDEISWWLPILGPTATVLAHLLARHTPTGGASWDTTELAMRVGLAGNRSGLFNSLNRLDMFGTGHFHSTDVFTIRVSLPPLNARHLTRLPGDMAAAYLNRHQPA
jgi:hypothetical protein